MVKRVVLLKDRITANSADAILFFFFFPFTVKEKEGAILEIGPYED